MSSPISMFETERLILRPTDLSDASFILELLNTPKWLKYIGDRKVYRLADAQTYIRTKILPDYERLGYCNFTVLRKEDQAKIGSCGLYDRPGLDGVDIGFAFLPQYEKKGYAYESATRILQAGLEEYDIEKILAITTKDNADSQSLLEKLGLQFVKITHIPNDPIELMLYEIKKGT